jgi:hypothetical protein
MSAEIIQFGAAGPKRTTRRIQNFPHAAADARAGTLTTAAKNRRLRDEQKKAWGRASALTNYWEARLNFMDAAAIAAHRELREEGCKIDNEARWAVVESYRAALSKQLLTAAPDVVSVNWKRVHMNEPCMDVTRERVEQAIADDMAFLSAHPTRGLKAKA